MTNKKNAAPKKDSAAKDAAANGQPKKEMVIDGVLDAFFETGTEGVIWSVYDESRNDENGYRSYDGLHCLEKGDILTVFNDKARKDVLWRGTVDLEFKTNWHSYNNPHYPDAGQQAVLGFWVNGLQRGMAPEDWAKMFFDEKPARLVRAQKPLKPQG